MYLGIIGYVGEESFRNAAANGISSIELDLNREDKVALFLSSIDKVNGWIKKYGVTVCAVGQWGTTRLLTDGTPNEKQLNEEKSLMLGASQVGCRVYVTGCNKVTLWDDDKDCEYAARYIGQLIEYGKTLGVKVCVYNCGWNNFIVSPQQWKPMLEKLPDLGIKYDLSHAITCGRDWREEMSTWGSHFYHVHIKGVLYLGDGRWDFPPAGLDQTDWHSFMGYLYAAGYDGCVSLEPHSSVWKGELGEKGVKYSADYIKKMIL